MQYQLENETYGMFKFAGTMIIEAESPIDAVRKFGYKNVKCFKDGNITVISDTGHYHYEGVL